MERTLNQIQTVMKIGKIVTKVLLVFCIVGLSLSVLGLLELVVGEITSFEIGGVLWKIKLTDQMGATMLEMYRDILTAIFILATDVVCVKLGMLYFTHELEAGTPFTKTGAKELMRFGAFRMILSVAVEALFGIAEAIIQLLVSDYLPKNETGHSGSIVFGAMLLMLALVCRYGAEREALRNPETVEMTENLCNNTKIQK